MTKPIRASRTLHPITSMKLHLGCQEKYLDGYVNIDLPPSEHTVERVKADRYADVRDLSYAENSISEIRSHHLLEHFTRQQALLLLARWHKWLKPNGLLVVETPDFEESAKKFLKANPDEQFVFGRHIYGSEEAAWATHKDYWSETKYRFVLSRLGFNDFRFDKFSNNVERKVLVIGKIPFPGKEKLIQTFKSIGLNNLPNIVCYARKTKSDIDYTKVIREILSKSLVGSEAKSNILDVWLSDVKEI